ncbi:MAG: hypothetical protein ABI624_02080 [Casimicrobiaceae bacterium]
MAGSLSALVGASLLPLPDLPGMPEKTGVLGRSRDADALVVMWPICSMVSALLSFAPRVPDARAQQTCSLDTAGEKIGEVGNC